MSKLSDLIRRASHAEPARLGFGAGTHTRTASMLLAASIGERWERGVGEAVAAGADVLLLAGRPSEKELPEAVSAADGRPCGRIADVEADQLPQLHDAGIDFLILDPQAPASVLQDEELGFVLRLAGDLSEAQLRTLGTLSLDALYVEGKDDGPPTIERQLELQRISGLARGPLFVQVRAGAEQQELLSLRDAGVIILSIALKERGGADALRSLRGVIDALPRRRKRRDEAEVALLHSVGRPEPEAEEDEEEEEERLLPDPHRP